MNASLRERHKRLGLCVECTSPATKGPRCDKHHLSNKLRARKRLKCEAYEVSGLGRPPKYMEDGK